MPACPHTRMKLRVLRIFKLFRVFRLSRSFQELEAEFNPSFFRLCRMILLLFVMWHFIACSYWGMVQVHHSTALSTEKQHFTQRRQHSAEAVSTQ